MVTPAPDETPKLLTKPRAQPLTSVLRALAAVLALTVALVGWLYTRAPAKVLLDHGVELTAVTLPREVAAGGALPVTFKLHTAAPLATDMWFFVHVEAESTEPNPCRVVSDALTSPPPSQWQDQEVTHALTLHMPSTCRAGRFRVFAGLYDKATRARLKVLQPPAFDDRIRAGFFDVVEAGAEADTQARTMSPRWMHLLTYGGLFRPWLPWLSCIFASTLVALLLYARRRPEDDDEQAASATLPLSQRVRWASWALPVVPFLLSILVVLEFVKDDAYISFRYAHNLVTGQGLVFNQGDKLEGFTNFLWVLILAPFEWLGWDLFQVCEVLGTLLGVACLVRATQFVTWVNGERKDFSQLFAALWLATSSSFALWAKSGLEQPLAQLLPIAGAWLLWRARAEQVGRLQQRAYLVAGVLLGMACMTRPELHLMAILVGLPLLFDVIKTRTLTQAQLYYAAGILAVTVPSHVFRYAYYGTLVPNTFFVKTGTGAQVWREGIQTLRAMFDFNHMGVLVVLAPLAFIDRRRLVEKAVMASISLAFMAFYVKVGADEMQWHRLYLPALPFTAVLAALGVQNLIDGALRLTHWRGLRTAAYAAAWCGMLFAGYSSFAFTYREQKGFNGHGDLAGTYHPDLGKFLVRHERPGALVAFQDMGSTPYHAPDIDFLDFIGLVDGTVAHARHDHGLHAFTGANNEGEQRKYDAEMREYFYARNPEWAILTIYTPSSELTRIAQAFAADPGPGALGETFNNNPYQFGIYAEPRFRERYVHVRTWQRSLGYYLSLWRRRDLWEQVPGEVVLDAVPAGITGPQVKFENGLALLGSELTTQTLERHEAFVTSWWQLPGPMPEDTVFFVHISGPGTQGSGDHTPGDAMWPGNRWQKGQILEDRTLFQLPPFTMKPGKYNVHLGVYQRSTGVRLKITEGPNDGKDRVPLGSFQVNPLRPLIHQLIPPTRVEVMRKYPERIIDSGRTPGQ